jgi:hypothetical protein
VLATFGRVPLFIYLLHLYVAHAVAVALWPAEGYDFHQLRGFGVQAAPPEGLGPVWPALMPPGSSSWPRFTRLPLVRRR